MLHNGADMGDGILTVVFHPFQNDGHKPLDVKGHHVFPVLDRGLKPFQNREKYLLHHPPVGFVQGKGPGVFQGGPEQPLVRRNIFKVGG